MRSSSRIFVVIALTVATARCSLATSSSGLTGAAEKDAATSNDGASDDEREPATSDAQDGGRDAPATGCGAADDPHNCGVCGHDCLGGACSGGTCAPYRLAEHLDAPGDVALDDTYLYWARSKSGGGGLIERVPLVGGAIEAVSDPHAATSAIALDGPYVFFSTENGVSRRRKDRSDDEKEIFSYATSAFVIDGGDAFFVVAGSTGSLWGGPSDGSLGASLLHYPLAYGDAIGLAGNDVVVGQSGAAELVAIPRDGGDGGAPTFAPGVARRIVTDDATLYFTEHGSDTIRAVPKTGGTPTPLAVGPAAVHDGSLAVDGAFVYWAVNQDSGAIVRAPRAGGAAEVLVTDARAPLGVAVDAKRVCWSLVDLGEAWCLAK